MECEPVDSIAIRVSDYRIADGGWLRLSFKWLAGDAGVSKVELTSSKPEVRALALPAGRRAGANASAQDRVHVQHRAGARDTPQPQRFPACIAARTMQLSSCWPPRPVRPQDPTGATHQRYDVWRPMRNTFGANWELSMLPSLPFDIRVTNTLGQQVVLK